MRTNDPEKLGAKITFGIPIVYGKCRRCGRAVSGEYHAPMNCANCQRIIIERARKIQQKANGKLSISELRDETRDQRKYHCD